jgi:hypothetical protein
MAMSTTRRTVMLGTAALAAAVTGSAAHQAWLWRGAAGTPVPRLDPIPVFDLRGSDPARHALARPAQLRDLAQACIGPLTPAARLALAGADALARNWLRASGTPYADELERIAAGAAIDGVHLLNASYEWGCTSLAAPAPEGGSARLLRTLDWPFHGLGRGVELWRQ